MLSSPTGVKPVQGTNENELARIVRGIRLRRVRTGNEREAH